MSDKIEDQKGYSSDFTVAFVTTDEDGHHTLIDPIRQEDTAI